MKTYVTKNYRMNGRFKTGLMLFTIVRLVSITVATVMLVLAYISSDALRLAYTILVIGLCALVSGMVSAGFFAKSTEL